MAERIHEMIVRAYKLRTCDGELHPSVDARPCFDYHIKRCDGPCALHQTIDDYRASVVEARDQLAGIEQGATAMLRHRMELASESMEFESAAMFRDGIREIERMMMHSSDTPLAVTQLNMIIVVPTSDRYATVELYAMRSGRLRLQRVVGMKAVNGPLIADLVSVYDSPPPSGRFSDLELDELRIITSWLHQRREHAFTHLVDPDDGDLHSQLMNAVKTLFANVRQRTNALVDAVSPSEYSQIPPSHIDHV
jgi:excinuclease ABC subunit C